MKFNQLKISLIKIYIINEVSLTKFAFLKEKEM